MSRRGQTTDIAAARAQTCPTIQQGIDLCTQSAARRCWCTTVCTPRQTRRRSRCATASTCTAVAGGRRNRSRIPHDDPGKPESRRSGDRCQRDHQADADSRAGRRRRRSRGRRRGQHRDARHVEPGSHADTNGAGERARRRRCRQGLPAPPGQGSRVADGQLRGARRVAGLLRRPASRFAWQGWPGRRRPEGVRRRNNCYEFLETRLRLCPSQRDRKPRPAGFTERIDRRRVRAEARARSPAMPASNPPRASDFAATMVAAGNAGACATQGGPTSPDLWGTVAAQRLASRRGRRAVRPAMSGVAVAAGLRAASASSGVEHHIREWRRSRWRRRRWLRWRRGWRRRAGRRLDRAAARGRQRRAGAAGRRAVAGAGRRRRQRRRRQCRRRGWHLVAPVVPAEAPTYFRYQCPGQSGRGGPGGDGGNSAGGAGGNGGPSINLALAASAALPAGADLAGYGGTPGMPGNVGNGVQTTLCTTPGGALGVGGGAATVLNFDKPPSNILSVGQRIAKGEYRVSPNGKVSLEMQTDSNLCLYEYASAFPTLPRTELWCSIQDEKWINTAQYLVMQPDGNLCVYDPNNQNPTLHHGGYLRPPRGLPERRGRRPHRGARRVDRLVVTAESAVVKAPAQRTMRSVLARSWETADRRHCSSQRLAPMRARRASPVRRVRRARAVAASRTRTSRSSTLRAST